MCLRGGGGGGGGQVRGGGRLLTSSSISSVTFLTNFSLSWRLALSELTLIPCLLSCSFSGFCSACAFASSSFCKCNTGINSMQCNRQL